MHNASRNVAETKRAARRTQLLPICARVWRSVFLSRGLDPFTCILLWSGLRTLSVVRTLDAAVLGGLHIAGDILRAHARAFAGSIG